MLRVPSRCLVALGLLCLAFTLKFLSHLVQSPGGEGLHTATQEAQQANATSDGTWGVLFTQTVSVIKAVATGDPPWIKHFY